MHRAARPWVFLVAVPGVLAASTLASDDLEAWLDADHDRQRLPSALREASGLALDGEGRLWTHDDERGVLYRIEEGDDIAERRVLGPEPVRGDFEGLAWDGARFHLTSSTGTLVTFAAGDSEEVRDYTVRRSGAEPLCEVEGLVYDPATTRLLMACKTIRHRPWRGHLVVLEVAVPDGASGGDEPIPVRPRYLIPPTVLEEADIDRLSPSGITRAPTDDGWWLIAARERRIVHISDDGRLVDHARLPSRHDQAEGVVIGSDGRLTLVDEGGDGRARITRYSRPEPEGGP